MKIGIVAPSPVPFVIGGAENLWWGLQNSINQATSHQAELIKLPSPESNLWEVVDSYRRFAGLDLSHFDLVISTKYPAWMVRHPNHVCYLQHRLRGLYDTYHFCREPLEPEADHPRVRQWLRFMRERRGDRRALDEWFAEADELRGRQDLPPGLFRFPGPIAREVVHFLDAAGLSPSAVARFAAISHNVARREGYFPEGVPVDVIHHPSNLQSFRNGEDNHLFTVCRLDNAKRVGLLIDAMKRVRSGIDLLIAGTGPEGDRLREQAAGDDRVKFLGFVNDRQVIDLYADALAVPYVPYDEDYGLVTIEAMASGKPVLTTTDSGGPNEFVRDGETGYSVLPEPEAIAERIDQLCEDRAHARQMGQNAERVVAPITWDRTVARLLEPEGSRYRSVIRWPGRRRKLTVAVPFPVYPPRGGGQSRVFHLYRHLARRFDVELVSFSADEKEAVDMEIAPALREIRIPRSTEHRHAETEISREVEWVPVSDVVLPELYHLTPAYVEALRRSADSADVVIACHPYLLPAIEAATDATVWYEAQDVEADLKDHIIPATPTGLRLRQAVRDVERACCERAGLIMTCCEADGRRLTALFGADPAALHVVPNGVDLDSASFFGPEERLAEKRAAGLEGQFIALFMGSWHGPNLEAVRRMFEFAARLPEIHFLVLGSAGMAFRDEPVPANVGLMGVVDDSTKQEVLSKVDLAINPMTSGTGTNLKMLDYLAAGIPVLSTPHGIRGLDLQDGVHLSVADLDDFPRAIREIRERWGALASVAQDTRDFVSRTYDWGVIADRFAEELSRRGALTGDGSSSLAGREWSRAADAVPI